MQNHAAAQRDLEEAKNKLEHWQVLIELLTGQQGFRLEFNADRSKIKIISQDQQKTTAIAHFFETLTPEIYHQTRAYQVQAANAQPTLATLLHTTVEPSKHPHAPVIHDADTAVEVFAGMFEADNFAGADLNLMFPANNPKDSNNICRFENGKLYSKTMEKKYIGMTWSQILQNIYNTFNQINVEQAKAALFGEPLKFQDVNLEGKEISTLLTQCFYMYPTHNDTRLCMVIDFTRLTQLLWAPRAEQTQERQEHLASFGVQALSAFLRQICGRQLYDIKDTGGTYLQVSPIVLSNAPTVHLGTDILLFGDGSGSMQGSIPKMLSEMYRLRNSFMREFPGATLQVVFFNDHIIFRKKYFSIQPGELERDLTAARIQADGNTALYDTLYKVFDEIYKADRGQPRKTIAITLTDGQETIRRTEQEILSGRQLLTTLMQQFVNNGRLQPSCYFVGLGKEWKEELHQVLATATGGAHYRVDNLQQMESTIFSNENTRKMQAVKQTLHFVFKTAEQEFVHHIDVEQADGPYCPKIVVPVPRGHAEFKIEMGQAQQKVKIDPNKLPSKRLSQTSLLLNKRRESIAALPLPQMQAAAGINALYKPASSTISQLPVAPIIPDVDSEEIAPLNEKIKFSDIKYNRDTDKMGQGGFGAVYRAKWQGKDVAVKVLLAASYSPAAVKELVEEAQIMNRVGNCDQIVDVYGVCISGPEKCIVMELMAGNLASHLANSHITIEWDTLCEYALDTTIGVSFLHSHGILHRDLKSLNVLLTANREHVKLCDFGLVHVKEISAAIGTTIQHETMSQYGTPLWMAPETLGYPAEYSRASDIYSLSMIFVELATRKMPWVGATNAFVVMGEVKGGKRPVFPAETPQRFAHLIRGCWAQLPDDRFKTPHIREELETFKKELQEQPKPKAPPRPKLIGS